MVFASLIFSSTQFLRKVASGAVQKLAGAVNSEEGAIASSKEVKNEMENWLETAIQVAYDFQVPEQKVWMFLCR